VSPKKRGRGRPKGKRDAEVVERRARMLAAWDRGERGDNKAATGRAYGFDRSDATKLINRHEREKAGQSQRERGRTEIDHEDGVKSFELIPPPFIAPPPSSSPRHFFSRRPQRSPE